MLPGQGCHIRGLDGKKTKKKKNAFVFHFSRKAESGSAQAFDTLVNQSSQHVLVQPGRLTVYRQSLQIPESLVVVNKISRSLCHSSPAALRLKCFQISVISSDGSVAILQQGSGMIANAVTPRNIIR